MPKQSLSHDVNVLNQKSSNSNDLPVTKRHTMVTNQLEDNTKNNSRLTKSNIHQQYQQQYQQEKQQQIDSTNSKIKKTSLTALNLIDKEDSFKSNKNSIINYGETIQSTKKMFANSSNINSLNYKTDTNGSTSKPLTSKSNHFELNSTNKDNKSNKMYNVVSMQPSPSKETKNRSGFDELDLLISKAKNLQTFQTSLLKQKNVPSKSRKNTSNSKSAVSDSRISLNQADISSNIARAKETIKKMNSSSNLEANNNMNTSNNNELPVLVALPMPNFSTPSYSSLGMGMPSFNTSNPSISMPQPQHQNQHQQMQQHQQQQQQQQYEQQQQMSQNQQAFQLPSNIPLVIPLGPPLETSSLYNLNQQFFQSAPLPIQKTVAKQKIKELKLKKQSKQSKSMEASINKIDKPTDFSLEKKLSKPTESILTTSSNDNTKDTTNDSVLSITEPVKEKELSYKQPSRLPPPPAVVIPKTINSESIISKKSDEESLVSSKKSSVHNEINARLKQSSLHITEPSTSPVPKDSILLITDSNYSVPGHYKSLMAEAAKITLDKPLRQPEPPAKPQETPLKAKDNSTTCTTMITNIKSAPANEPRQVELLNNTKPVDNTLKTKTIITNNSVKKLNDLTELLNAKYGIYKGNNLVTSQAPVAQLQSKSQPQVQPQPIAKPVIETKISPVVSSDSQQPPITELRKLPQQLQQQQQQTTNPTKSGPPEYKTSLHIGKQFNSNEITVHLVDDTLEDKKTNVKKLIVHCNRIEPISSRSITLNPGQFNAPTTLDLNLNDGKNYLRKELKREIVLPNDCDIDSLESYLENGYLHFKCYLIKPAVNELKHAQIVSLPRLEFKNDQSTIIKRSLLNLERESNELSKKKFNNSSRSDFINKSILKLNSDEISDPKQNSDNLNESATTSETTSQFIQLEPKPHKPNANRGRHQSLPSGSSTKSVRFNMNNRTFQLEDQNGKNDNKKNDSITNSTGAKISRHNSSSSNGQAHRHRHRSNSTKSKPDSAHRRTSSNTSNNLTNRLSNDLINDGFNCITKDGLENIFLTYFFKLPSCSPSDRTQVRIEKNSILKLKIIQEKNFAKKNKSRKHNHRQHHRHHGSSSSSLSSSIISSALSSSSDSSMSSSLSSDSDESTVNNEKITKIKQENETTKIVLREFSRRCRLPYKVFKFDETGVTVSFINNDWVRVEIPIMEILDNNLMATMTSESNFSIFNKRVRTNTKLDHKSSQQLENSKNSNEFKEEKMNSNLKLKMGGSGVYKTSNHNLITSSSKYL